MTKSKIFFILSLAFIGGVFGASFWYPRNFDSFLLFFPLIISLVVIVIFYKNRPALIAGFFILFFIFGIHLTEKNLDSLKNAQGKDFSGEVMVIREPELKNGYQNLKITPLLGHPVSKGGKFIARTGIFPEYRYGDILKINCRLEIPKNNKESNFDYRMYLAKDGIFWECKSPKIESPPAEGKANGGNKIYVFVLNLRNKVDSKIAAFLPAPQSGLLSGLLLGGDDQMSKNYQEAFSITGMTHIVAVSGYNVTIIAEYLMALGIFLGLWRRQAFWLAILGIFLFIFMIGFPSSAVRAGIMGGLLLWGIKNGRLANSQNAILASAVVMLFINPLLLRWDIGFQLSFLATLGIIYIYPLFQNYLVKKYKAFGITEILMLTISAQIFVLPVIFINFEKLSLVSPLANILVLPIIPLTMLLGFLAVAFSFVFPPFGQVFFWLAFLPLKYETELIRYMASLKYASLKIESFPWWVVVLWYIILLGGIFLFKKKIKKESSSLDKDN